MSDGDEEHQVTLRVQRAGARVLFEYDDGPAGSGLALYTAKTFVASAPEILVERVHAVRDGSGAEHHTAYPIGTFVGKLTLHPDGDFSVRFTRASEEQ